MSDLTSQSLFEMVRDLHKMYPPEPSPFRDLLRPMVPNLGGLKVYEKPPPPPKIQVRELLLDDGTPILTPAFRDRMNVWLADRFGRQEDSIYFISGLGIAMSKQNMAVLMNVTA